MAQCLQEYEAQLTIDYFFVETHQLQVLIRAQMGGNYRQSGTLKDLSYPAYILITNPSQTLRQICSHDRTGCNCFTMQPHTISHTVFNRMTKGMPKIQQSAFATFTFVITHDFSLVFTAACNGILQRLDISCQQFFHIGFQPFQKRQVTYQAIFDYLCQAST